MGGALSLNCPKIPGSWRGALGNAEASGAGDGSELRGFGTWRAFWCRFSRCFGVGFRGVSVLVLYQKANKRWQAERAKTARKTATKKRKNPDKIKTFSHFSIDK